MSKRNRKYKQSNFFPKYLVSIIIPVHRRFDLLKKCVDAIPEAFGDISYEVIIVDNGSDKDEKALIYPELKKKSNFRVFEWKENHGFPKACNFGARQAESPLLFILTSDVVMSPLSGIQTVKLLDDPKVGIAGMKLLFPNDAEEKKLRTDIRPSGKVQHVGLATNIRGEVHHVLSGWSSDNPKVLKIKEVYMVTGAALMTRKPLFAKVGGFDEVFGMGTYEDIDYCLKIRSLGYNIVIDPTTYAIHYTGATAEGYQIQFPLNQNRFLFVQKWIGKVEYSDWLYY